MKGLIDSRVTHSGPSVCSCFWSMVLWRSLQVMTLQTLRVPVCDGILNKLSFQLISQAWHSQSHGRACSSLYSSPCDAVRLGVCSPVLVVMEPGKEGRKSNIDFKECSIFPSWLLFFSTCDKDKAILSCWALSSFFIYLFAMKRHHDESNL